MAPLTPLRSGGLSVPTSLSATHGSLPGSCRDISGSFSGRSGDAALPLVCLCLPRARYSHSDLNICKCCCGAPLSPPSKENSHQQQQPSDPTPTPSSYTHTHTQTRTPPVSLNFPHSFPPLFFLSLAASLGRAARRLWEPDLLCHTDLFWGRVRLLITRRTPTVDHRKLGKIGAQQRSIPSHGHWTRRGLSCRCWMAERASSGFSMRRRGNGRTQSRPFVASVEWKGHIP